MRHRRSVASDSAPARHGFTLIELLVVILIMVIIAGMLFPVIGMVRKRATIAKTESLLQVVHAGLGKYQTLYLDYPPTAATPTDTNRLAWYLCAPEADVTPTSKRSSVLLDRISPKRIDGEAIVDPFESRPLIYISTKSDGSPRDTVPLPDDLGSDATDATQTAYAGYESVFELWSAGPDRSFDVVRNAEVNDDNLSITAPFGDVNAR